MDNFKKVQTGKIIKSKIKLSIIIPCYNEEKNIPILLKRIDSIKNKDFEIIIVNNGSKDETKNLLNNISFDPNLSIINLDRNFGYGGGILKGINKAKGEVISWTHSDLQTDVKDVVNSYYYYKSRPNYKNYILKGKRTKRNTFDNFFTFMMSIISSVYLRYFLTDINAQPKLFHREFLSQLDDAPTDFSLDLFLLFRAKSVGKSILEFPVSFNKRIYEEAKGGGSFLGKINLVIRTFIYIFKLKKKEVKNGSHNP